jgi:hypothetical protein
MTSESFETIKLNMYANEALAIKKCVAVVGVLAVFWESRFDPA